MMNLLLAYYLVLAVVFIARINRNHKRIKPNKRIKAKSSLIHFLKVNKSI
jgi:hypothetical protein